MSGRRKRLGLAAIVALAVTGAVAVPATALDESISDFALGGAGRGWDFSNAPFGVSDGNIAVPGRVADDGFDEPSLVWSMNTGGGGPDVLYSDPDGIGNFSQKNNSLSLSPAPSVDGLLVSRVETAKGPYLRSLIKIQNPTNSAHTEVGRWTADFGSDTSEETQASSSGDRSFSKADRWIVSSESGANAVDDDPVLAFALRGKSVSTKTTGYTPLQGPGNGLLTVFYLTTKIPANGTRYLLFFTEMHPSVSSAKKSMRKYDSRGLSKGLLKGISKNTQGRILNWDL